MEGEGDWFWGESPVGGAKKLGGGGGGAAVSRFFTIYTGHARRCR